MEFEKQFDELGNNIIGTIFGRGNTMSSPDARDLARKIMSENVIPFISQSIEEERKRIEGIIESNSKGSFTDEGGNDCWYIDDLLAEINKSIKEIK